MKQADVMAILKKWSAWSTCDHKSITPKILDLQIKIAAAVMMASQQADIVYDPLKDLPSIIDYINAVDRYRFNT